MKWNLRATAPRVAPIGLLLAAVVAFFWKIATFQGALFFFDLIDFTVPAREFFFKNVAHGRFPLWSPEICGGFPLFDEGQMGPLYWPNYLLFTWLSPWWALNVSALLHAACGALGAYFYLKRTHSAGASAVGAMTFVFAFPIISHQIHFMFYESICLMPWLFFFADRFLSKGRIADALAGGLVLGMMFTTGHQQGAVFIALAFGVFCAALIVEALAGRRTDAALGIAGLGLAMAAIALAASAVVVHGMAQLLAQSVRHKQLDASFIFLYSLVPDALARLASPALHGRGMNNDWLLPGMVEREVAVYLGLAAWCFAAVAFAGRSSRRDRAHLVVVAFGLLFVLGNAGPLAGLVLHTPLLNRMRIPTRFFMPLSLPLAFLIASGLDRLRDEKARWRTIAPLVGGAAAWATTAWVSAWIVYSHKLFLRRPADLHAVVAAQLREDLVARSILAGGLVAAALFLFWARKKKPVWQWAALTAIGVAVFIDLASAGREENPVADPAMFHPLATLDYLAPRIGERRIYSPDNWGTVSSRGGWRKNMRQYAASIETLPVASPAMYGYRTASCVSPLTLERQQRVLNRVSRFAPEWLRQMAVKYVLGREGVQTHLPKVQTANRIGIYEIAESPPIYGLAQDVIPVADSNAAFNVIDRHNIDAELAVVEGADAAQFSPLPDGEVETLDEQPDVRRLRVSTDRPSFLIIRENYYPGWQATVDGAPAKTYHANYLFWGVPVAAGVHEVALSFRPAGFRPMLAVSLLSTLATLGLALFYRPFRRKRPAFDDEPESAPAGKIALAVILWLFVALVVVAIVQHPKLWDFSHLASPR